MSQEPSSSRRARGGRPAGTQNFSDSDLTVLLNLVEQIQPIGGEMWMRLTERYNTYAQNLGRTLRDSHALQQKFGKMADDPKPTGDPNIPPLIRRAKNIDRDICGGVRHRVLDDNIDSQEEDNTNDGGFYEHSMNDIVSEANVFEQESTTTYSSSNTLAQGTNLPNLSPMTPPRRVSSNANNRSYIPPQRSSTHSEKRKCAPSETLQQTLLDALKPANQEKPLLQQILAKEVRDLRKKIETLTDEHHKMQVEMERKFGLLNLKYLRIDTYINQVKGDTAKRLRENSISYKKQIENFHQQDLEEEQEWWDRNEKTIADAIGGKRKRSPEQSDDNDESDIIYPSSQYYGSQAK